MFLPTIAQPADEAWGEAKAPHALLHLSDGIGNAPPGPCLRLGVQDAITGVGIAIPRLPYAPRINDPTGSRERKRNSSFIGAYGGKLPW
jgi:hypothetical protein